jgi:4-amino-4-deoxy-L-arabinose transferase-like glycosyltransferase
MLAPGTRPANLTALVCGALGALAFGVVIFGTPHGVGLSTDSSVYVAAARSLASGRGAVVRGEPLTHFPPLYPATLALGSRIASDPVAAARWLHAGLFAATVGLAAACAGSLTGAPAAGLVAGLFVLVCRSTLRAHLMLWSEPLFLLLGLAAFALLARHLRRPRTGLYLAAVAALAAALLTRYAGLALLPPAGLALLLWGRGSAGRRAAEAGALLALASAPLLLWLVRNRAAGGSAVNRTLAFHPLGAAHVEDALRTLSFWVWPFQMGSGLGIAVLVGMFVWAARAQLAEREPAYLQLLVWLFAASYALFLALSVSFVDAGTPLQERVLSPLYVFGVVLGVTLLWKDLAARRSRALRIAVAVALVGMLGAHALRGFDLWRVANDRGLGYADQRWSASELLREVRGLPDAALLYSNAPDLIDLLLDRETRWLPHRIDTTSSTSNPELETELERLRRDLEAGARVAWFEAFSGRQQLVELAALQQELGIVPLKTLDDGLILGRPRDAPAGRWRKGPG